MKRIIIIFILLKSYLFAFPSDVKSIYAIGIFNEDGKGENIQHVLKTKYDYNDICYSKIFVLGDNFDSLPEVSIGNSKGHYQSKISIFNSKKKKIGEELLYKHYKVSKGYIEVRLKGKLYDTKVFVK